MKFKVRDKRIWIKGLTLECPLGIPDRDCPLNALRPLPVTQMNKTINSLTDEQVESIFKIHRQCYKDNINEIRKAQTQTC